MLAVILAAGGIVCIAVSYFMGGGIDSLYNNQDAKPVLDMLTQENIVNSINNIIAFFGV